MGRNPSWLPILAAYGAVYVIWGSTFLSIRFAVETVPPLLSGGVGYLCAGMEMVMGGVLLVIVVFALGEGSQFIPSQVSPRSFLAMGYFAVFGSVVALTAFFWLLKVEPASRVATHGFVNPVVAVFLGGAPGGEVLF